MRALKLYLANLKQYFDLKEEMLIWEDAGFEDVSKWNEDNLKDE